jgi:hypothetical protein
MTSLVLAAPHRRQNCGASIVTAIHPGSIHMTRASVAVIVLCATAAVTGAQAQIQTASSEPTIWDHNGSVMYLVTNGSSREFHYQKPRPGMNIISGWTRGKAITVEPVLVSEWII